MRTREIAFMLSVVVVVLTLSGCDWLGKRATQETVFDRIVNIPKEFVLDMPQLPPLCDVLPDIKKGFADILGGKLYYEEEGHGVPLVLINGGPGSTHHMFHPQFSRYKEFAHVIYYDQRGTGKATSRDDTGKTYSLRQAIEDLESLRKALKLDQWFVLGQSYGGLLAQCYALTYPERVKGLILCSSLDGLKKVDAMKNNRQQEFISKEEQEAIKKVWAAKDAGKLTLAQAYYNASLAGDWKRNSYEKPAPEELIRTALYVWDPAPGFRELIFSDYEGFCGLDGKFDDFEIPTLIIEGKWDSNWGTDKIEFMRKNHPHAQVEVFEKSGHGISSVEKDKFFDILRKFLEKADKAQIEYKPGNRLPWPKPRSDEEIKAIMSKALQDKQEGENK